MYVDTQHAPLGKRTDLFNVGPYIIIYGPWTIYYNIWSVWNYKEFAVEALIGILTDDKDVFLVSIKEIVKSKNEDGDNCAVL